MLYCSKPEHVDPDSLNCSKPEHAGSDSLNCSKPDLDGNIDSSNKLQYEFELSKLKLPAKINIRGRPRGSLLTTIGNRRKRDRKGNAIDKKNNKTKETKENKTPVSKIQDVEAMGINPANNQRFIEFYRELEYPDQRSIIQVPGDGHCLLYSWVIALRASEKSGIRPSYEELKAMLRQSFASYYGEEHREFMCDQEENVNLQDELSEFIDRKNYGRQVGDEMIINVLATITKVRVGVWQR
ncbi:uncharacterized protein [Clytia hemisphaerica]|uniref:uncharacterized protein n=1 Tax=Clytia hemisphaerica TaxID=252671 RepID=UPI0034D57C19